MTDDERAALTPLSDAELAEIESRVWTFQHSPDEASFVMKMDACRLLREVKRLRMRAYEEVWQDGRLVSRREVRPPKTPSDA